MPTFVTNPKMDPELRARIEASLRGSRRIGARPGHGRRYVGLARLVLWGVLIFATIAFALGLWEQRREREHLRARLLQNVEQVASRMPREVGKVLPTVAAILGKAATTNDESNSAKVHDPAQLGQILGRSALYLRVGSGQIADQESLARAAAESTKDAFLYCWVVPPASHDEASLLHEVRAVYRGEALQDPQLAHFYRLYDVFFALNYLGPEWLTRVRAARDVFEVTELQNKFEAAQLEHVLPALQADLLIYLIDEPKEPGVASELDGAYPHFVRVGMVDLRDGRSLLRARRRLDPSWISERARAQFASGLDACRLAFDLRAELTRK